MKNLSRILFALLLLPAFGAVTAQPKQKIVVAYVCSWTDLRLPDPSLMTHINYAFGHVNKTFDGCDVQNPEFLKRVVGLKRQKPSLKIQLSVGGWTSGNFSEMAADAKCRMAFARDCGRIVKEYGLDGIDIDWEYPTSSEAGISSSPDDTRNFTLLMRDLRKVLGKDKLLTCATIADGKYVDFPACVKYMDFVNIMAYDVADPPRHHTTLFRSPLSGRITVSEAVEAHIRNGVPKEKLCLGMPLYGRGDHGNAILDKYMKTGYTAGLYQEHWDAVGQVPYLTDWSGQLVWGAENPRSIAAKCQYIIDRGLLGGMYWETTEDNAQLDLMRTIHLSLMRNGRATVPQKRVLLLTAGDDPSALDALNRMGASNGFEVEAFRKGDAYTPRLFDRYHLVYDAGLQPDEWPAEARADFEKYIDQARGSYLALHADTATTWKWYTDFYRHNYDKHARTVLYKRNAPLGYMPRAVSDVAATEQAVKWLLHQ
ncbi:chitinase B family protein [Segatella baroniae F0067]|uniref:chitinase n=1 Tax=Segatella baroniae F0067 TaxID=1115809 RepID=U2QBE7_9BACT|nr:glycosyl hydrolase family 18 protein [Segatella baroniae]ERK38633.1 chitinase B family protein [Segatella baroniae F0067]